MFIQRALITFILLPIAIFVIVKGDWYFFLFMSAIILIGSVEYSRMLGRLGWRIPLGILAPAVLLQLVDGQWPHLGLGEPALAISVMVAMAFSLWSYEKRESDTVPADWLAMMAGILLLGWLGSHFFRLRGMADMGWQWTLLAMLSTWMADSAAYVVGKFLTGNVLGRHRLSPRLSPNKTVEGYLGGVVFGTSVTVIVASSIGFPVVAALVLGLLISILSPLGDLGISLLKREANIKDSGALFLQHGGALDRTDSLVWSVTLAYYLALLVG